MSWINNTLRPNGADLWQQNGVADPSPFDGGLASGNAPGSYGGAADGYRPSWWGSAASPGSSSAYGGASNTTDGMLGQIIAMLQQLMAGIGSGSGGNAYGQGQPYGPWSSPCPTPASGTGAAPGTATFANATLSSSGDPHLALTGTVQNGNGATSALNAHYDDMNSQRDLLSTGDFGDAFRVSTTATSPNASGVTYNGTATATMDHGLDTVSMGPGGAVSVTSNGNAIALSAGQSVRLGGGELVSENARGSVSIAEQNAAGEALTTTFTNNGSGVDVTATASGGVTLGGSLVRHAVNGA